MQQPEFYFRSYVGRYENAHVWYQKLNRASRTVIYKLSKKEIHETPWDICMDINVAFRIPPFCSAFQELES